MKKTILGVIATLLVLATVAVGCTGAQPAATAPEVTEGVLEEVSPQEGTVTVETPQGPTTFPISPTTELTIEGKTCSLEDIDKLVASGDTYNCTIIYDEEGNTLAVNVTKLPEPASTAGTISDVNVEKSTITVQSASGPLLYEVDPTTGLIMGGVACTLEQVNALLELNPDLPCRVIYSVDEQGKALYFDISNPPDFTQATGTLTGIDEGTSTVTIQTNLGPRTYKIDAQTGLFLYGEACSLDELQMFAEEPGNVPCQVIYYTDADGNLVYIALK